MKNYPELRYSSKIKDTSVTLIKSQNPVAAVNRGRLMRAKLIVKAALVALTTGIVPAAYAADLGLGPLRGTQHASIMAQTQVWDGVYIGGFGGTTEIRSRSNSRLMPSTFPGGTNNTAIAIANGTFGPLWPPYKTANRTTFGVFGGINYQYDDVVLGFEADFSIANITATGVERRSSATYTSYTARNTTEIREIVTIRGRAGYTSGSFMPFATAGLAIARANVEQELRAVHASNPALSDSISKRTSGTLAFGLTAGLGVDVALSENLFLRGEWQYLWLPEVAKTSLSANSFRAAAGVKF
jgi:outer membrane immunogenic protein